MLNMLFLHKGLDPWHGHGQTEARGPHAARQSFIAAPVAKYTDVFGHNFVINQLKLKYFQLKMRKKPPIFFFCCGLQYYFFLKSGPRTKKSGHPWCIRYQVRVQKWNFILSRWEKMKTMVIFNSQKMKTILCYDMLNNYTYIYFFIATNKGSLALHTSIFKNSFISKIKKW